MNHQFENSLSPKLFLLDPSTIKVRKYTKRDKGSYLPRGSPCFPVESFLCLTSVSPCNCCKLINQCN